MPPTGPKRGPVNLLAGRGPSLYPAERQHNGRGFGLRPQNPERTGQILSEHKDQQTRNTQVAEGAPFESAAGAPRACRFPFERLPETSGGQSRFRQRSRVSAKWRRWRPRRNRHFVLNLLNLPIAHVMTRFSGRPKARGRSRNLSVGTGRVYSVPSGASFLPLSTVLSMLIYNVLQVGGAQPSDRLPGEGSRNLSGSPRTGGAGSGRRTVTCHSFLGSLEVARALLKIAGLFCARIERNRTS